MSRLALFSALFALGATTAPILQPPAAALSTPAIEPGDADPSERPDAVSAMTTARVTGEPVEDLSQRTESVLVFAQPDGSWSQEVATGPVRVEDAESGEWSDIDTTLVPAPDGAEGFVPQAALGGLVVSAGGDGSFASMEVEGRPLEWQWPTELPEPVIEGSTATYPDVLADGLSGDLVVTAMPGGFRHDIVLNETPATAEEPAETSDIDGVGGATADAGAAAAPVFEIPIVTGRGPQLELDEAQGEARWR